MLIQLLNFLSYLNYQLLFYSGDPETQLGHTFCFIFSSGVWSKSNTLEIPRKYHSSWTSSNGIFLIGGQGQQGNHWDNTSLTVEIGKPVTFF